MRTITLFYLFFFSYAYLSAQPCKELNVWVDENYHSWSEPKRLEMTEAVLNVCEESIQNDTLEYAAMLNNYSSALWYNDKGKESLEVAQKAYKLIYPKREADWKLFANILNNRGTSFDKIGLLKKAQADFEEAVRIKEDMGFGDSLTTVFSLWNLGDAYKDLGKFELCRNCYEKSLKIIEKERGKEDFIYGIGLQKLGRFYNLVGMYDKALEIALESKEHAQAFRDNEGFNYAIRLNFLARILENMKRFEDALEVYEEGAAFVKDRYGDQSLNYAMSLIYLGNENKHLKKHEESLAYFMQAKDIILQYGNEDTGFYFYEFFSNDLATLYGRMRDYEKADTALQISLKIAKKRLKEGYNKHYPTTVQNYGNLQMHKEDFKKAFQYFEEANEIYHQKIEDVFGVLNEYETEQFLKLLSRQFNLYRYFAKKAHQTVPEVTGMVYNDALALKALLLQKNKALFESIRQSKDTLLVSNFEEWLSMRALFSAQSSMPNKDRSYDVDSLSTQVEYLERILVEYSAPLRDVLRRVRWEEVRQSLKPDEAAIEFIRFDFPDHNYHDSIFYSALIIRPDSEYPRMISLFKEHELDSLFSQRIFPTQRYIKTIYSPTLTNMIWQPIEPFLEGINTIYYAPEGMLHRISLNGLPFENGKFLSEKYDLQYVNSTRNLVIKNRERLANYQKIALFGGIEYEGEFDEKETPLASSGESEFSEWKEERGWDMIKDSSRSIRFNFLKYTDKEVSEIEHHFQEGGNSPTIYRDKEASESLFKSFGKMGSSPDVIHMATHGFFFSDPSQNDISTTDANIRDWLRKSDNPLFRSGLALSESNLAWEHGIFRPNEEDGILTAHEIAQMNLTNTDLVVLSACQSGLGDVRGSEGVYGLQRAFKMAGVDYLLLTLWNIRDGEETVEFMTTFYEHILSENSVRSAFRMTQNQMRKRYKYPYFWAGFVLID